MLTGRPDDGDTPGAGTIWLLKDATHQRAERERLAWSARHEGLTRLLNRAAFEKRLRAQIDSGTPGVLLALDLDHFKQVNDAAGHTAGDRVMRDVAALLLQQPRGDEFALLLSPGDAAGATALAQHLCEAVAPPGRRAPGPLAGGGRQHRRSRAGGRRHGGCLAGGCRLRLLRGPSGAVAAGLAAEARCILSSRSGLDR
jgi:GGDEF domain-containing protein